MRMLKIGVSFACLLFAGTVRATILVPGSPDTFPDVFAAAGEASQLAFNTGPFTTPAPSAMGTFKDGVFLGTANAVCPAGGCLDFVYQFSLTSTSLNPLESISGSDFTGLMTDVGFVIDGGALPGGSFATGDVGNPPGSVARPSNASVDLKFGPPNAPLAAGDVSAVLIIQTNAKAFKACTMCVGVAGGGPTTNVDGFTPLPNVPEPGFYGILAFGLAILFTVAKYRRGQTA